MLWWEELGVEQINRVWILVFLKDETQEEKQF